MVRVRGGSAGAGCTTWLRDENIEIVEHSTTKSLRKGTETRGGKRKQSAKKKQTAQTEEQQTVEPSAEPSVESSTRKSPRTRTVEPSDVPTAQRSGKRKCPAKMHPEAQNKEEPTSLSKFIDDDARERFE